MNMQSEPLLEVKGLKTYFFLDEGTVKAVDGADFSIQPGSTVGIVGESGCGKSVTAFSILQLVGSPWPDRDRANLVQPPGAGQRRNRDH